MRPIGLGLIAALMVALMAPAAAMAAPAKAATPTVRPEDRKAGMADAPAIVSSANLPCQVSDARLAGKAPADKKTQVRALQQALTAGPFYKELSRRAGRPRACGVALDDGGIRISYAFRGNASLVSQVSVGSESTDQRMEFRNISTKAAMALLKRAEKDAFGQDGCGIVWDHAAEELRGKQAESREVVYRGETHSGELSSGPKANWQLSFWQRLERNRRPSLPVCD